MTTMVAQEAPTLIDAVIDEVEDIAEGIVSLVLRRPDGQEFPHWTPGSHIDLHLGNGLTRQYSLWSPVDDLTQLRVGVLRTLDSRGGSEWIHDNLRSGDQISISAPRNNFPLVDSRKYMFIARGIGITPLISMIQQVEEQGREWQLYYGGRSRASMALAKQLEEEYGTDKVHIFDEDVRGRLDLETVLAMPRAHMLVYACGPSGMLKIIEDFCMGWPPGTLHTERFVADSLGAAGNPDPFTVELARSGKSLTVPPEKSILEVMEENGTRVLSSCRAGLCGTCETRIIAGEAEHRDAALTQEDKDSGDVMMVCVSRAAAGCNRLVLDL